MRIHLSNFRISNIEPSTQATCVYISEHLAVITSGSLIFHTKYMVVAISAIRITRHLLYTNSGEISN